MEGDGLQRSGVLIPAAACTDPYHSGNSDFCHPEDHFCRSRIAIQPAIWIVEPAYLQHREAPCKPLVPCKLSRDTWDEINCILRVR